MLPTNEPERLTTITIRSGTKQRIIEVWKGENRTRADEDKIKSYDKLFNELLDALE